MMDKGIQFNTEVIPSLEKKYLVEYPVLQNATYKSFVNYATDLNYPIQRWYRYKEGYSVKLVQELFDEYKVDRDELVLDPFCGSGSTILQAKTSGFKGVGFEINPFSVLVAKVKTQNYTERDLKEFKNEAQKLLNLIDTRAITEKPKLSTIDKLFNGDVLKYLLGLKTKIQNMKNPRVKDLFFLAWLSILEEASNYRKSGNGLKIRRGKNLRVRDLDYARLLFRSRIREIGADLPFAIKISQEVQEPIIYEHTALEMDKFINPRSVRGVIFSPPYANCFDYTEIYKVELWLGGFVKDYSDLKILRKRAIRSHLNGYNGENEIKRNLIHELDVLTDTLSEIKLWDKRIPKMIGSYFSDMFVALDKIYRVLKSGGFCSIIVSNSAYGGVIVPTDLLLTKYAEEIGFRALKIDVARFIITSSQQYKQTERNKKYLRESIIHLVK